MPGGRAAAVLLALGTLVALPHADATFTAVTSNSGNQVTAAATFPTYVTSVGTSPLFYHRQAELASSAATSSAADSSGHALAGTYNGRTDGPVAFWAFDENGGTRTLDQSGWVTTGTFDGNAGWAGGKSGSAFGVAAGTGSVRGAGPVIHTDGSFSVSAWVYLTAKGANRTAVSQVGNAASGFALQYNSSDNWCLSLTAADAAGAAVTKVCSLLPASLNTWTHLVGVFDDSAHSMRLYINGISIATTSRPSNWDARGELRVGDDRANNTDTDQWLGLVDEVRVYDRVLSGSEAGSLYNSGSGTPAAVMTNVLTAGRSGALQGPQQAEQSNTAMSFLGAVGAYNPTQYTNPTTFTLECWFRTTSVAGGAILGFNSSTTANGTKDRVIYLDSANRVRFFLGTTVSVVDPGSPANDGQWHYVAASLGPAGTRLYVDGSLVDANPNTAAATYPGYWRWGGFDLTGVVAGPSGNFFNGAIDEVAVYPTQLSDQAVAWHYYANH